LKRWLSMILAYALLFTSTPLTSAQDSPKSSNQSSNMTVTSSVYGADESLSDSEELITITSITEIFGVARDWVVNEIVKGYQLHHIYQGLLLQQKGGSYEQFMEQQYPTLVTDPLHAHNASVTAAVYGPVSVTDQVYGGEEPRSVTDLVYNPQHRVKRSLSDSPYDKVALQRAPIRLDQAPYAVGSETDHISTVDASLRVEATDLVMPGANGLDFALRRVYDSSRAKNDITFNPGSYKENITKQSTDEEGRFKLGKGWIWDISYFKRVDGQMYLYISGLGTYRIDGSNIVGYPFHDLNFSESENVKIGSEKAAYELANYKTGVRQYFNAVGDLILIKDKDGNYIQFIYHGTVLGIVVTSNSSKTNANAMIFTYNPDNTIVVESGGRTVVYKKQRVTSINGESVLEQDLLTEVIDPMGRSTKYNYSVWKDLFFNFARDHKDYRKYGQSDLMRMKWGRNDTIALSVIEHPTKAITRFAFDSTVFRKIGEYAEEETIRYKTRRDSYSSASGTHQNELIFTFNNGDVGKEFKDNSFSVDVTDGLKTTTYVYDKRYNGSDAPSSLYLEETRTRTDSGNEARTVRYQYDRGMRNPNPIRIEEVRSSDGRNSAPRITTRTYDGENWGYIVSEKNPLGATSRYEYGRLESPNKRKGLIRSDVPTGQSMILRSEYQYDRSTGGLLQVQSKNEQGTIVQQLNYEYDPMGNPITIRIKGEPRDTVIQQEFSPEFRTMFLNKQSVNVTNVDGAPDSIVSRMEYNTSTGDPTKYIDGNGNETKYTHDKLGRMTAEIYADGTQTAVAYDDAANKITITYPNGQQIEKWFDPLGNLIKETNGRGGLARHTYDRYGHMIRKGTFDDNWIEYEYDAWGRVTKENFIYGQNRTIYDDAANTKTTYDGANNGIRETYDVMDRLITKEEIKPSGQAVAAARYEYDLAGNVQTAYDGNHNATKYEYDALGRLIAVTDAEGKTTRYRYNLSGDMVEIKYADGNTVEKRYDEIGRLLQQIDPMKQSKRFYYDGNGNVIKSIDRKGQVQQFEYSNRNFLTALIAPDERISYSYDATGKRTAMTDQTGTTTYAYYPTGELASITYPDQTRINYDYEVRGLRTEQTVTAGGYKITQRIGHLGILPNPTSMAVLDANGSQLTQFEYKYDGSYTRLVELKSAQGFLENFAYDGFNLAGIQQKHGAALFGNYSYTYDNNRNIVAKNDNGAAYQFSYDLLNRIKTSSQFNEAYAYDQRDNRSTLQSDQIPNIKGASYAYDSRNRLTQVTTEDGKAVSYRYNGDNLMVERTEGGVTTRYYYDDRAKIIAEGRVEGNGSVTITAAYVHDSNGKLLARQVPGQGMQYYVSNGHGDIIEIRDAQGNVLNRYAYDIWGNPLVQEEQVPNIFRYSGEYWDAATNLQYLRARWYDPSVGRFINEDTYEGDIKDPLSLNLYTYVENNPLQYIDPTGNNKCAFTETAMECVGNGKGGGGGSAGNSYVGSTVVRGNAYAPPPKITRASPKVKFEVSWNEAKSFNKLNIEKAMKPKVSGNGSKVSPITLSDSKMYQLGDHFNKHGRGMGYESKKAYDLAAKEFASINQNNPKARIVEGTWNGSGSLNGTNQRAIIYDGRTVVIDTKSGQVIDFFVGTEYKGINVIMLQ